MTHGGNAGNHEKLIITVDGQLLFKAENVFLTYYEEMEGIGEIHNIIKIKENTALIRRTGALSMRQPLAENRTLNGTYHAPYGIMETEATARKISASWNEKQQEGIIHLIYEMKMQGQHAGRFDLTYRFAASLKGARL
ncbi:DUF1934 domain-containing protein [Terrilactibacillus sp. S3-3]|nr:DUF1934 domain-containing protein [Terrilactibacillus sp. S3-3]